MPVVQATTPSSPRSIAPVYSVGDSIWSSGRPPSVAGGIRWSDPRVGSRGRPPRGGRAPVLPGVAEFPCAVDPQGLRLRRGGDGVDARLEAVEPAEHGLLRALPVRLHLVARDLEPGDAVERRAERRGVLALALLLLDLEAVEPREQLRLDLRAARFGLAEAQLDVLEALGRLRDVRPGGRSGRRRGAGGRRRRLEARAQRHDLARDR